MADCKKIGQPTNFIVGRCQRDRNTMRLLNITVNTEIQRFRMKQSIHKL